MKAVVFKEFGGPSVVHVSEVDVPEVGAGQVLIDVRAASVNPVDVKRIGGLFGPIDFPAVTGADASGVVTALGADVSDLEVGDAVFGIGSGTHAEQAVLTAAARKPDQLSWIEAAAAGVGGETAFRVLTLLGVESGSTVLIDGASGGVGTFAVQMAVARGATVITTASEANHEYLQSLGAIAISYGDGLASRVADVAPDGVDGVFDVAGKTDPMVLVGIAPSADQVVSIANFEAGDSGIRVTAGGETDAAEALRRVAELATTQKLVIPIDKLYTFDQAAEAFRLSEDGHVRGKLVLTPQRENA